ncbi:MAG: TauD/TfdA family dioxygenase [Actinomycetota bacterium]
MEIVATSPFVGAEIRGVDLRSVTDDEFDAIQQAFIQHGVIFFRDQELSPAEHIAFAERWGTINVNRFFPAVDGFPQIAEVRKEPGQLANIGGAWHTDHSYDQIPALGSILYAREVPPIGGDTLFASQYAAFDALSASLQDTLRDLWADHSSRLAFGAPSDRFNNAENATQDSLHPVVIEHPLSGRPALYVNLAFTLRFHGWSDAESKPLLHYLYDHASRPEFTTRFEWEPGSMAIWDNRAVQHNALNDYHGHRRLMHRITIEGTEVAPARPQPRPDAVAA